MILAVKGQTDARIPGAPAGAQWQRHAFDRAMAVIAKHVKKFTQG